MAEQMQTEPTTEIVTFQQQSQQMMTFMAKLAENSLEMQKYAMQNQKDMLSVREDIRDLQNTVGDLVKGGVQHSNAIQNGVAASQYSSQFKFIASLVLTQSTATGRVVATPAVNPSTGEHVFIFNVLAIDYMLKHQFTSGARSKYGFEGSRGLNRQIQTAFAPLLPVNMNSDTVRYFYGLLPLKEYKSGGVDVMEKAMVVISQSKWNEAMSVLEGELPPLEPNEIDDRVKVPVTSKLDCWFTDDVTEETILSHFQTPVGEDPADGCGWLWGSPMHSGAFGVAWKEMLVSQGQLSEGDDMQFHIRGLSNIDRRKPIEDAATVAASTAEYIEGTSAAIEAAHEAEMERKRVWAKRKRAREEAKAAGGEEPEEGGKKKRRTKKD